MLEWYRLGFDSRQLRNELEDLVDLALGSEPYQTITYRNLVGKEIGVDVVQASPEELQRAATDHGYSGSDDVSEMCDFLYSYALDKYECPRFFVIDFPVESAALAQTKMSESGRVADRFELIVSHLELANGYNELLDPSELEARISEDNRKRRIQSKSLVIPDERLLAAMRHGMPQCSGVALGLDRLVALSLGFDNLSQVMTFPGDNA
jgi:lysyl-tRNA synthetase class 2